MEQTIRERRFGSLSARRKQKDEGANTVYESMNKATTRPDKFRTFDSNRATDDSNSCSPGSSSEVNASSSVETLSDISVTTPGGLPVVVSDLKKKPNDATDILFENQSLHLIMPSIPKEKTLSSPKPVLAPSLSKASDFAFDRYSKVIDSPEIDKLDLDDVEIYEVCEVPTPIEVATPITYIRPNRPSMVSIFHILDKESNRDSMKSLPMKPDLPARNPERPLINKRLSTLSTRSGFIAGEAIPFQVPNLPDNALTMISNASHTDLSIYNRHPEPALKKQKSSMTLLSKAIKYGHSRMASRAQSTSPSPQESRLQSQHEAPVPRRPAASTRLPPPPSQLPPVPSYQPQPYRYASSNPLSSRPQTAAPSTSPPGVTALPLCTSTISQRSSTMPTNSTTPHAFMTHNSRKKSLSALRSRSDSIGNALMAITSKRSKGRNVAREALTTSPGLPVEKTEIGMGTGRKSVDLTSFPPPPTVGRPISGYDGRSFSRPLRGGNMEGRGLGVAVN
jgi:hypothetical protein